ncbi:MAG: alpha/beta hydrolase, partial [Pseudomonadota bacterium]
QGDDVRLMADRERVELNTDQLVIDVADVHARLACPAESLSLAELEHLAGSLGEVFLDGLDGAGGAPFAAWLEVERQDLRAARISILQRLCQHPDLTAQAHQKWCTVLTRLTPDPVPGPAAMAPARAFAQMQVQDRPTPSERWRQVRSRTLRTQRIGFCEAADGVKIAHATVGSGPPILKAANWLNHLEFDWSSPIWGKSFEAIAKSRTFIRYDERGCGLSDWDVGDLSFDAFVEDLDAVVTELGLTRFPLLGISQGCAVSIEYAVRYPERVSALVLFGGYAAGWRHLATAQEQARREAVIRLTEVGWGTDTPAYRHIFSQTFMPDARPEDLAWFDEFQRLTTSPLNAARFQEAFGQIDVRHRLADVRVPTLVLHSAEDQRIPLEQGRAIASAIAGAQFVPLDSRNHILVDHEPAWRVAYAAISRFLKDV